MVKGVKCLLLWFVFLQFIVWALVCRSFVVSTLCLSLPDRGLIHRSVDVIRIGVPSGSHYEQDVKRPFCFLYGSTVVFSYSKRSKSSYSY